MNCDTILRLQFGRSVILTVRIKDLRMAWICIHGYSKKWALGERIIEERSIGEHGHHSCKIEKILWWESDM